MKKKHKRKKGESKANYDHRLSLWKIDKAFESKASHLKGSAISRNQEWRTLEAERKMFADEDSQW